MENNWTIGQTKKLFSIAAESAKEGKGLVYAFNRMASECGRSANSVRNYYYSQLKMFELVPSLAADLGITIVESRRGEFEMFADEEIVELVETILIGKARGESVRAVIATLSEGDGKKALRYQNKYRSMIAHHRPKVNEIMNNMTNRGINFFNPYTKSMSDAQVKTDNLTLLSEYIDKLDEKDVGKFLNIISKLM